jgi:hypothetical protein
LNLRNDEKSESDDVMSTQVCMLDVATEIVLQDVKKAKKQTRIEDCWGITLKNVSSTKKCPGMKSKMKSKNVSAKKPTPKLKMKLKPSPGTKKSNFEKNLSFFRQQENVSIHSLEVANSVNINISGENMLAKFGHLISTKSEKPKLNTLRKQISDRVPEDIYLANT